LSSPRTRTNFFLLVFVCCFCASFACFLTATIAHCDCCYMHILLFEFSHYFRNKY